MYHDLCSHRRISLFLAGFFWIVVCSVNCSFFSPLSMHHMHRMLRSTSVDVSKCIAPSLNSITSDKHMLRHENRMVPYQQYSGLMNYEDYRYWLRYPLDHNATISSASTETYFTSSNERLINPPQIQPKHLQPIYIDDHIIVLNKPSGILSVPGPRRHECVASLAYRYFGKGLHDSETYNIDDLEGQGHINNPLNDEDNKQLDKMIVHRLDRDTSGVILLARNDNALKVLHNDFKNKNNARVKKTYMALVCGHWNGMALFGSSIATAEGEIDLPLVRDIEFPPFMRVATVESEEMQRKIIDEHSDSNDGQHSGFLRMIGKGAKPSLTYYRLLSHEYLIDESSKNSGRLPVTRVELQPITGRTHQLRVHCAAMGHPIVGDSIYGYRGEGSPNAGLNTMDSENEKLQQDIYNFWLSKQGKRKSNGDVCMLCLHAQQLNVFHPYTNTPMSFASHPPF